MRIYSLYTSSPSSIFPFWAPVEHGGPGDQRPKIREIMERTGRGLEEVADEA